MAKFLVRLTNRRSVEVEATQFEDSEDGKWITFVELVPVVGRGVSGASGTRTEQVRRFRSEAVREIERVSGRGNRRGTVDLQVEERDGVGAERPLG
jgi:hypothetical protein